MNWGDKISDVEPKWIPLCHNCMENTEDMYNKELCQKCFSNGVIPSTDKYMANGSYIPPRCKECKHNNPDYICIENNGNEIWLACSWCGYPTLKD